MRIGFIWKRTLQYIQFAAYTAGYENSLTTIMKTKEEYKNSYRVQMLLLPETNPSRWSCYNNILRKMDTQLSTTRMMLTHKLLRRLQILHDNVTVFAEDTYIFITLVTLLGPWIKLLWKSTKRRIKLKSW